MSESRSSNDPEHKSPRESGEDSEDESEILEESPCGRWLKRREEVSAVMSKWEVILSLKKRSSWVWDNELRIDISLSFQGFYLFSYSGFGRFLSVKF